MERAGTTLAQNVASSSGYSGWWNDAAGIVRRFRKPIVASSLMCGDAGAAIAAITLSDALSQMTGLEPPNIKHLPIAFLILTLSSFRLYTGSGPSPYERLRLRAIGNMGFVTIDFLIRFSIDRPGPFLVAEACTALQLFAFLLIFGHYVEGAIRALLIRLNLWGAPTALIGCGDNSRRLARLLMSEPALGLTPIGFIGNPSDGASQRGTFPVPLIGTTTEPDRIRSRFEFAIFNSADELSALTSSPLAWTSSCRHLLVDEAHYIRGLYFRSRMLGGAIGVEIGNGLRLRRNRVLKRAIDIFFAVPIALLVWPIIVVLALAIKFVDPGPAFYVQKRVGSNATTLRMFKLRTMYADAEQRLEEYLGRDPRARAEWQRFFKLSRDPRVLPAIGNLMRRTSLDELPQLWNVIRGDMSLVGPRPFPSYHMSGFDDEFRSLRVSVPPGITGFWQVSSRSNGDLEVQKAQDLFYIRNWSLWLDMYILLQTVPAVFRIKRAK